MLVVKQSPGFGHDTNWLFFLLMMNACGSTAQRGASNCEGSQMVLWSLPWHEMTEEVHDPCLTRQWFTNCVNETTARR